MLVGPEAVPGPQGVVDGSVDVDHRQIGLGDAAPDPDVVPGQRHFDFRKDSRAEPEVFEGVRLLRG
jgi:hypothetical protein